MKEKKEHRSQIQQRRRRRRKNADSSVTDSTNKQDQEPSVTDSTKKSIQTNKLLKLQINREGEGEERTHPSSASFFNCMSHKMKKKGQIWRRRTKIDPNPVKEGQIWRRRTKIDPRKARYGAGEPRSTQIC